jgi:hypothetical protein
MSFVAVHAIGNPNVKLAQGIGVNVTLSKVPSMRHRADSPRTQCSSRAQAALFSILGNTNPLLRQPEIEILAFTNSWIHP